MTQTAAMATRQPHRLAMAVLLAGLTVAAPTSHASTKAVHPHGDILAMAEMAALDAARAEGLDEVEVRVRPLDRRLRPSQCDAPLEIVRPHSGRVLGPVSYGVSCPGTIPWTLYLRADVSAAVELPVLRAPLPRGTVLSEGDLEMTRRRITQRATDLILDPSLAIGMELLRPLPAGATLRYGHVDHPELISRGQTVTLVTGGEGLEVRMQGKAMGNGARGDRLVVTNLASGRRVEGVVLSDGSVRIP